MARASVNRVIQVGAESTKGTPVAASKQLPSTNIRLSREIDVTPFRAQGFKTATTSQITKDFGSWQVDAPVTFLEILYLLSTLTTAAITTPGGATLARRWLFTLLASGADSFTTLTIQEGDSNAALQMAYSVLTEFGFDYNENGATVSGSGIGRSPTSGSLTSSPTAISQLPGSPRGVDVYVDAIGGTIGTTKAATAKRAFWRIASKQAANWVLNTTYASFIDTVEVVPTVTAGFTQEFDAQGRAFYDAITAASNPVKLVRLLITGPLIEGSTYYTIKVDFPAQIIAAPLDDFDGVYGAAFELLPQYNSVFGNKLAEIEVITTATAL